MEIKLRKLEIKDAPLMREWMLDEDVISKFRFNRENSNPEKIKSFISNSFTNDNQHFAIVNESDEYLLKQKLNVELMRRGMTWLDTGNPRSMLQASQFVETIQERQGLYVACLEEIAWRNGFINDKQLEQLGENLKQTEYGQYILSLKK